jgi:hypothetical protein
MEVMRSMNIARLQYHFIVSLNEVVPFDGAQSSAI